MPKQYQVVFILYSNKHIFFVRHTDQCITERNHSPTSRQEVGDKLLIGQPYVADSLRPSHTMAAIT